MSMAGTEQERKPWEMKVCVRHAKIPRFFSLVRWMGR